MVGGEQQFNLQVRKHGLGSTGKSDKPPCPKSTEAVFNTNRL